MSEHPADQPGEGFKHIRRERKIIRESLEIARQNRETKAAQALIRMAKTAKQNQVREMDDIQSYENG